MLSALSAVRRFARERPNAPALEGDSHVLSYASLGAEVDNLVRRLNASGAMRVGVLLHNSPAWVVMDLAASAANMVNVPLPPFFTDAQLQHVVRQAGLDLIVTDYPARLTALLEGAKLRPLGRVGGKDVWTFSRANVAAPRLNSETRKITFTSGTTGEPKGVCLSNESINRVTESLAGLMTPTERDRHLCLLPLSVLLENIAGVYVALRRGVPCSVRSSASLGTVGSAGLDPTRFAGVIAQSRATSIVTIPQMLQAVVELVERGLKLPDLRFVAVGGAPVSRALLDRAAALGLPVFEGYGLSECASVVAVNAPDRLRLGSVGKPLPHLGVRFAKDGEILVKGNRFLGYLGDDDPAGGAAELSTGDIGYLDRDGYLYITGRKKNMFITSFGRNVAPEWVERELAVHPAIAQAVVFGESRPWATALIVPRAAASREEIDSAVAAANARLPDYARIGSWLLADEAFTVSNALYTATGRPRRREIWQRYAKRVESVYHTNSDSERRQK